MHSGSSVSPLPRVAALAVMVILAILAAAPHAHAAPSIQAYRGAGVWVDIFDDAIWASPERHVRRMSANGVRTLYLQTSNSSQRFAIYRPDRTARLIEASHARGIKVVAWYLPTLTDTGRDLSRSAAAVRYRTPHGQRFDSFALDIEAVSVRDVDVRNARLLSLSRRIRAAAGARYPLGAIILSPRGLELHPRYWPRFPYRALRQHYDVFLPMVYSSYHVDGAAAARLDTTRALDILRREAGTPPPPTHLIAGIADELSAGESLTVVRAAREYGLLGASMYDLNTMGSEEWSALRQSPVNPPQPVPMPLPLGSSGTFGYRAGPGSAHPTDVVFTLPASSGDVTINYEAYDIGAGEISVLVDWKPVATLPPSPAGQWSGPHTIVLTDSATPSRGPSTVIFTTGRLSVPFTTWGLRGVMLGGSQAASS